MPEGLGNRENNRSVLFLIMNVASEGNIYNKRPFVYNKYFIMLSMKHSRWRSSAMLYYACVSYAYHIVAAEEGVDGIKVIIKELRDAVDDIKGDGLQNIHHLHIFP